VPAGLHLFLILGMRLRFKLSVSLPGIIVQKAVWATEQVWMDKILICTRLQNGSGEWSSI